MVSLAVRFERSYELIKARVWVRMSHHWDRPALPLTATDRSFWHVTTGHPEGGEVLLGRGRLSLSAH